MRKCTKTLSETETLEIYQNKLPWLHLLDQDVDFTGHTNAYCFISFNIQITHSIYSSYNRHHYTRSWSQEPHINVVGNNSDRSIKTGQLKKMQVLILLYNLNTKVKFGPSDLGQPPMF